MIAILRRALRRARRFIDPWRITRFNICGWECERWNRRTGEFQHRHYTSQNWAWQPGRNPHRRNAFKVVQA